MTPQQEKILRQEAKARGYDKAQQDAFIEFAASQMPASTPADETSAPRQDGFFKSLAKGVAKMPARVGASVYNIGAAGFNLAKGDVRKASEEVNKTRNILGIQAKPYAL